MKIIPVKPNPQPKDWDFGKHGFWQVLNQPDDQEFDIVRFIELWRRTERRYAPLTFTKTAEAFWSDVRNWKMDYEEGEDCEMGAHYADFYPRLLKHYKTDNARTLVAHLTFDYCTTYLCDCDPDLEWQC